LDPRNAGIAFHYSSQVFCFNSTSQSLQKIIGGKMFKKTLFFATIIVALLFSTGFASPFATQASAASQGQSFIVMGTGNSLPANIVNRINQAGGTITRTIPEIGVAVVSASKPNFATSAARIPGISSVMPNVSIQWIDPQRNIASEFTVDSIGNPPFSGSADPFFDLQWGHTAVEAPAAWEKGGRGAGARVAVLDSGFDLTHPDLVPNINFDLSKNFVDGEELQYGLPDPFSHGTHVAGTIAAAQNNFGVIGVAPDAELVLVKVLGDAGSGSFADVMAGIVYAANVKADVINMSLGASLPRRGFQDADGTFVKANEVAALLNALNRATNYAFKKGTTVIASAGNSGLDSNTTKDLVHVPSQSTNVISISATAPIGWATDPLNIDLDNLASYSNYGLSHITFAAPGGDFVYPGEEACTVAGLTRPCWVFDLVFSTGNGSWYWSAGTSMAAPHASGVAAIMIGRYGSMKPAQVEAKLKAAADDLGKPGRDAYYGHGRVNAFNTVSDWNTLNLTILHTNDFHARVDQYNRNGARCTPADETAGLCIAGAPRLATVVNQIRSETENVLLLDAGDQFQGTLFFNLFQGDVLNTTMNYIGYDAMTIGNHEFDSGPAILADFISQSAFPVVSANTVIDAANEPELASLVHPYVILQRGGHKIGVIGLITPDTSNISSPGPYVTFTDTTTALQAAADELTAKGVNKIIALTHVGFDYDLNLAQNVSGVDIIIGGHSHSFTYSPAVPISFSPPTFPQFGPLAPVDTYPSVQTNPAGEPVLVVTAYQWGTFLGNLNVIFTPDGKLLHNEGNPIFLGSNVAKDPVLDAMLDPYRFEVADLIATPVGETTVDLLINVGGQQICRLGECLMGNLVADAMLWMANEAEPGAGYQIAFQNGGGLRAPILTGPVTMGDVLETLPFGNAIATFELQGTYVKAALENGASRYPSANGGFAQVAGLRYTINAGQPVGSRVSNIQVWNGTGWDDLVLSAMYKAVTNDFMRKGGDNYLMFRDHAVNPYDFGPALDEALAEYFRKFSPVTPVIEGRVNIAP
jgi:lantibiotic leader peptide-processing serine protease